MTIRHRHPSAINAGLWMPILLYTVHEWFRVPLSLETLGKCVSWSTASYSQAHCLYWGQHRPHEITNKLILVPQFSKLKATTLPPLFNVLPGRQVMSTGRDLLNKAIGNSDEMTNQALF